MKLREDIGKAYMGIPLYNIHFIQEGETYMMGAYVADSVITRIDDYKYVAEITNLEKLSEKYDFTELVHEMVEKSKQIEAE